MRINIGDGVRLYVDVTGFGYDHRKQGRSDRRTADEWNLDTWADDVVRLCDALGIEKPIVLGNSFGGFVAQRYLGRHPDHPAAVVLGSTAARWDNDAVLAKFLELGGQEAVDAATTFWAEPTPDTRSVYLSVCGPLYTQSPGNTFEMVEMVRTPELFAHWNVASLPADVVQFERFEHSGHGVFRDEPDRAKAVLRQFIASSSLAR